MTIPSATWNTKPVFVTYRNVLTGNLEAGSWVVRNTQRVANNLGGGKWVIFRAGTIAQGTLNTVDGSPSLQFNAPILDDPDITPSGGEIVISITFASGGTEELRIVPHASWSPLGTDLANPSPSSTSTSVCGIAISGLAVCAA